MAHPLAFAAFMRHIGSRVEPLLEKQGLPLSHEDPSAFVPLVRAWRFFDATAQREDPMLAWHVGRFVGDQNLNGGLLTKLETAPSLYQALQNLIRLVSSEASHLRLGLEERDHDVRFYTHYPDMKGVRGYHGSQAYQFGVYLSVVRHYAGRDWVPPEIGIEYPVVPKAAEALYPDTRILAPQPYGYISIPRRILHLPPPHSNGADGSGQAIVLTKDLDYVTILRTLLRTYLGDGYPDTAFAASLMDTSVRTLERRLAESGTTYRAVVDSVRFAEAKKLLQQTDAPIIYIASAVGFDDASHFARMFRRVGGVSPREFRKNHD